MTFISEKRLEILEKRVADLEKQVQDQPQKIIDDVKHSAEHAIDLISHIPQEQQQK